MKLTLIILAIVLIFVPLSSSTITGDQIAVIMSGSYTDFGYNNRIVFGVSEMERTLDLAYTRIVSNILNRSSCIEKMIELVKMDFKIIVSTTGSHGNASYTVGLMYPNVTFAQPNGGGGGVLPNLFTLSWNSAEMYYALGAFAASQTKNKKIGFIHPGYPTGSVGPLNAFFIGAKDADDNIDLYIYTTSSYLDPDRATGASNLLLDDIGVDVITGQQDDFTIIDITLERKMLALGVSGYPMREIKGQAMGASIIRDWSYHFINLVKYVIGMAEGIKPPSMTITGSFANGNIFLEGPGHNVTAEQWDVVNKTMESLYNKKSPYYCGKWVNELKPNNSVDCISSPTQYNQRILSGIKNLGEYRVPVKTVAVNSHLRTTLIVLAGFFIVAFGLIFIPLYLFRGSIQIYFSSIPSMVVILLGGIITLVGVIVWSLDPLSDSLCRSRAWLPIIGCTMMLTPAVLKNFRVCLMFVKAGKSNSATLNKIFNIKGLLVMLFGFLVIIIILLSVYSTVGGLRMDYMQGIQGLRRYERSHICVTNEKGPIILGLILTLIGAVLVKGIFVSIGARNAIHEDLNESKIMGYLIMMLAFISTLSVVILASLNPTENQKEIIAGFSLLIASIISVGVMFAPKFMDIYTYGRDGSDPNIKMTVESIKKSSSGSSNNNNNTRSSTMMGGGGGGSTRGSGRSSGGRNGNSPQRSASGGSSIASSEAVVVV